MTGIAVLTTDGRRDCIQRTIESAETSLHGRITDRLIFTDTTEDGGYERWLHDMAPAWGIITTGPKRGYAAAMQREWEILRDSGRDYWFALEDDFTFNAPVDLTELAAVLRRNPQLAQLALRRQPWNEEEAAAGGIVESHPDWYTDCRDNDLRVAWLEQTAFWTNNPSLIPAWVFQTPYPATEGEFTFALKLARPDVCFGYWGDRESGEAVTHIGEIRTGASY